MDEKIQKRIIEMKALINEITKSKKYYFKNIKPKMLEENLTVVYIIADVKTNEVYYAGRTTKLRRRLYTNHLQGNPSTARLKKYLIEDNDRFPYITSLEDAKLWMKDNCYFQFLQVDNSKDRGHIEGLFGYVFNTYFIENEH